MCASLLASDPDPVPAGGGKIVLGGAGSRRGERAFTDGDGVFLPGEGETGIWPRMGRIGSGSTCHILTTTPGSGSHT